MFAIYTEEEKRQLGIIQKHYRELIANAADEAERQKLRIQLLDALDIHMRQYDTRFFKEQFKGDNEAIRKDAIWQAHHTLESYYATAINLTSGASEEQIAKFGLVHGDREQLLLKPRTAAAIIRREIKLHLDALKQDHSALQKLLVTVSNIINASPFTTDDTITWKDLISTDTPLSIEQDNVLFKANMPMYHGKATDALAAMTSKGAEINQLSDKATLQAITGDGVYKVVIQDFSKLKGKVSVNTHKLLSTAVAEFTQINNYGGGAIEPKVTIPFDQYARKLGYEIDERPTTTIEDAAREKKRVAEARKTAKRRIRQDLEMLQAMRWTWTEKVKGEVGDFDSINLLDRTAIKNGHIIMEFGHNMAEYLKRLPITQYPQGLLAVDARKVNAYNMGLQMAIHFNMDNNQVKGTANRLKVSTLLKYTSLPTLDDLQNEKQDNSRQWYTRIKEPFEAALDELTGKVISSWEYVKAKGTPLTVEEAYNITDYVTFAGFLVQFDLLDAVDHEERLTRRAEDKKKAAAKKAAARKRGQQDQEDIGNIMTYTY